MARKSRLARLIATAVTAVALASAAPASAQPVEQDGLVNVNIQDVEVLVPVSVAANICDVNVGILARQERQGGAECNATAESIASPGASDGAGPCRRRGLSTSTSKASRCSSR
jgi:hypothetical protein